MTERIQTLSSTGLGFAEIASAAPTGQGGEYRGERVNALPDAASLLDAAAEELTFSISEHVEKDLSKRKVGEQPPDRRVKVEVMIEQYSQKLPDLPIEKLKLFLTYLKSQPDLTAAQIRAEAKNRFGDVSHQYAALAFSRESLADDTGAERLQGALDAALDGLLDEHGPAVRAGLNISVAAQTFADARLGNAGDLRDFYRATVVDFDSLADAYGAIVARYGEADFGKALAFLLKAAGDDLGAKGPSTSAVELKTIVDELYRLEVLSGMREHSQALVDAVRARAAIHENYSGHSLLQSVLKLQQESWLGANQVLAVGQEMNLREIDTEIYFLRGLSELTREIPLKAYPDPANREKLRDAVQDALDDAIAREEA
ncbi:MAG: type III secretion system gatekeeper subunit SctW [Candidatus Competibacteraceae bacterium]|nr:type III secretion system gatekeeper subunit SctW [Candidatus Competibacteraceae bacterium]MBK8896462.1 type III secretion system gatekeeper subunit SctW [Candidatus Competibacteraceae bacterium]MBK8964063.1 type III secretion system gatekeeper subunit SctW [Candidatus Competibacteraceae bacterium]